MDKPFTENELWQTMQLDGVWDFRLGDGAWTNSLETNPMGSWLLKRLTQQRDHKRNDS